MTPTPSSDILVRHFRQILIWPLFIHKVIESKKTSLERKMFLDEVTADLESKAWRWSDRNSATVKLAALPGYDAETDYSEIVYFHSFVRDFLYGGDGTSADERPLRIFRRDDVHSWRVTLAKDREYRFSVARCELYLFESGVLILVLEATDPKRADDNDALRLCEILDLQNVIRIAFPRGWDQHGNPKESPLSVELWSGTGKLAAQDYRQIEFFTAIVRDRAELPVAEHLQFLLRPLGLYGKAAEGYCYQQIEDQRIPCMSYIAVDDPREISEWDYARLTFIDGCGESAVGSYSDDFLKGWDKGSAYDRFWQRCLSFGDSTGVEEHNATMRTRWLSSGYGIAVVGTAGDSFFTGQLLSNFRHHYFRMALIAHFHRASILICRDALADAMKWKEETARNRAIVGVQKDMVAFRSLYWFREVSTQLQGQELFRWWSDLLENGELFQQVSDDIDAAATLVRVQQQEAESQKITQLTAAAVVVGGLTLMSTILTWSFLRTGEPQSTLSFAVAWDVVKKAFIALAVLALIAYPLYKLMLRFFKKPMDRNGNI